MPIANAGPTDFSRSQRPREDWLALAEPEEPIEPALPIIDTHMHLWHHGSGYRYFVEEFARDVSESGHNVVSSVFVECGSMYKAEGPTWLKSVGETQFAAGMAAIAESGKYTSTGVAAAIVANVDPSLGDKLPSVLDAHEAAANGRLRGIRYRAKWDPDPAVRGPVSADRPELYLDPDFQEGVREIGRRGLVFEASIFHPQIPDVATLARAAPETEIVLVHSGSPVGHSSYAGRGDEVHEFWMGAMRELASCANVSVKLGGILMPLANFDYGREPVPPTSGQIAALWRPYIEPCFELFGSERCMAASNFPVDKMGLSYGTVWNMFKLIAAGCSADEKSDIFSRTAERVYSLRAIQV